jgi:hypothetical protein
MSQNTAEGQLTAQLGAVDGFGKLINGGGGATAPGLSRRDRVANEADARAKLDEARRDHVNNQGDSGPGGLGPESAPGGVGTKALGVVKKNDTIINELAARATAALKAGAGSGDASGAIGAYTTAIGNYTKELKIVVESLKHG